MYSFESFNIGEIKSESKTPPAVEPHDDPKPTPPKPTPPEPKNPEPKQPTPPKPVNPKEPWEEWPKPKSYKKKSKYKVIFKDYDGVTLKTGTYKRGTLLLNMKPSKPKRESTSKYNFKFAGWSVNGSIVSDSYMLLDNTVFTAKYTKSQIKKPTPSTKKYNYTFKNWDGSTGAFLPIDDEWVLNKAHKLLAIMDRKIPVIKSNKKSEIKKVSATRLF